MAKSRSLNWRLGVSTLVIVLPLALFALITVGWIAHSEREDAKNELIGDAYAFADTVGRQINAYFLLSASLSHSRLLQHGDLTGFAEQARDTLADAPGVKLIVSTAGGAPVLSVPPQPLDSPLLRDRSALVRRAIDSGAAFLSDVNADPSLPAPHASIETPVFLDGKPVYEIGMLFPLDQFQDLMRRQNFPPNRLSGIVDRKGAFVARIPSESARPGTLASAEFRAATRNVPESTVTHNTIGGEKVVSAYAPVEGGWTVGVAADAGGLGIGRSAFLITSLLAALALLGSLLLSYLNGRALTRRVRDLESKTKNVLTGEPISLTSMGVREFDSLSDTLVRTSELLALRTEQHRHTERELRIREEHFRLLADSLPQLVWTAGPDGRIEYANARRERYGAIGQTDPDWEGIIHPDDRRATAEAWLRARQAAAPYEMEHRLFAVGKGYAWHLSRASPLLDAQGAVVRWYGTTTDIDDQKHREANIRNLMAEVNHRSRNLLAVAQAIARSGATNAKTIHEFQERYSERLLGLAASQDLLTDRDWHGVPLDALVRAQTARCPEKRFVSEGPLVLLSPNATQTLGLALRELCDNALKHGAFTEAHGKVSVTWRIDDREAEPRLEILWQERGGPPVKPLVSAGFGKVVIERLTAAGLNASSVLSFEPDGVTWRLIGPLKDIGEPGPPNASASESRTEAASG